VLTILLGSSEDLDAIVALEASRDTMEWLGETGPAWHQRALADPDQEYLLAEDENGHLLGFALLAGLKRPDRRVELRRIVISTKRRGEGLGRELLHAAVTRSYTRHRAAQVWLDVKAQNSRARALYESAGFSADKPGPVAPNDDLIVMVHASAGQWDENAKP
jgi:ribosomal protein S18 acetylase RimI-like enzyme